MILSPKKDGIVRVLGAREHNLRNVNVDIPRDALVVFTGVSGSGKSCSLLARFTLKRSVAIQNSIRPTHAGCSINSPFPPDLLRMLYSRAGDYARDEPLLYAESFSPNPAEGDEGGQIVAAGPPALVVGNRNSKAAPLLAARLWISFELRRDKTESRGQCERLMLRRVLSKDRSQSS